MCRIAAYAGPAIPLENIIVRPRHSLLTQSQHANEAKLAVNGDGFGISWYGEGQAPGLYRDVLPAWADDNLTHLCRMVRSQLFIAHIRASTVGETSRANCHPFAYDRWSFCHNGQIPHFGQIKRRMMAALPDDLFDARRGTADSELIFLSMQAHGLDRDVAGAIATTLNDIGPEGASGPVKLTCVFSDGDTLYAFRHASSGNSPTLYLSGVLDNGGRAVASEPLCGVTERWTALPCNVLCRISADGLQTESISLPVAA
ncbi:class II glutamine amidotransferase [Yoonia sp.]|uniref:class II glutamine amidotransferase n=1 Tax=Yoonia sp. TaxID=2212373 RepID=UPI003F6ABF7E